MLAAIRDFGFESLSKRINESNESVKLDYGNGIALRDSFARRDSAILAVDSDEDSCGSESSENSSRWREYVSPRDKPLSEKPTEETICLPR